MFPSFTGSTRKPRQVNLSGRNSNPFASSSAPTSSSSSSQTSSRAVLQAQHERLARQQDRERTLAAKAVQRTWRGHASRQTTRQIYREEWDRREQASQYACEEEALAQVRLLVRFASPRHDEDVARVTQCAARIVEWLSGNSTTTDGVVERWRFPLLRLNRLICAILDRGAGLTALADGPLEALLLLLKVSTHYMGKSSYSLAYYEALSRMLQHPELFHVRDLGALKDTLVAPLHRTSMDTLAEYRSFASEILTIPELIASLRDDQGLLQAVDPQKLAKAVREMLSTDACSKPILEKGSERTLWLLSYFINICRRTTLTKHLDEGFSANRTFVISTLLSPLAEEVNLRTNGLIRSTATPLPAFIQGELSTLVDQKNITTLLSQTQSTENGRERAQTLSNDAATLATFALTLLRIFPRRADEIQLWLNMGTVSGNQDGSQVKRSPAAKYLWEAASKTSVYRLVCQNPQNAVKLLQSDSKASGKDHVSSETEAPVEWKILLLFMELYTFILKVTDDEEFMNKKLIRSDEAIWTRQSSLELKQVQELTLFLKNFAFALYWHGSRILGYEESRNTANLAEYFRTTDTSSETQKEGSSKSFENVTVKGLNGVSLTYMKGLTTGLLRMIYERDSRRKFLPLGFWLMTDYFDMEGFIPAVVKEEGLKNKAQDDDGAEDEEDTISEIEDAHHDEDSLVGTSRTQQVRRIDRLRKQQRKNARQKQLEAIAPRLEILQNMPFFIPFVTRVEIFHQFIFKDKYNRREGYPDPDEWRLSVVERLSHSRGENGRLEARNVLHGQQARIRRDFTFDDAYAQYYGLGERLKEPIQITFVDQFDTPEAGIDGGGVTKEFLTSVTHEAFTPTAGLNMFIENDQNLLYPNPSAVDERKEYLREAGIEEGTPDFGEAVRDLLRRYEFLGRIIGKCLYEGILIDIQFAPFFLVKWALTGGSGSATNETNYRANLNDLRDLDETLYQGLLKLKDYPGNVEDFSLDFTVTDNISTSYHDLDINGAPTQKTITRNLRPNGSEVLVTNENRLVYISFMARYRLQVHPHQQTSAFLKGLGSMIQPSWLSMFNQSELQTLVGGGTSEIDVSDLRRNTYYGGVFVIGDDNEEHPTVKMFWDVMQAFTDQQRRKVLKYVTSTPRGPLLGFSTLNPRFNIRDSGSDQARLPSTSTCVNLLKLPIYRSKVVLKEKLEYAIESGAGFDLS